MIESSQITKNRLKEQRNRKTAEAKSLHKTLFIFMEK